MSVKGQAAQPYESKIKYKMNYFVDVGQLNASGIKVGD